TDLAIGRGDFRRPEFLAGRFVQGPNDLVVAAIAHAEDTAGRDGRRTVAAAERVEFPEQRRSFLGPFFQQARLARDGGAILALPLRPVEVPRSRGRSRRERRYPN